MAPTGHIAIAFFSKRYAPKHNLFFLLFASYFIDVFYFFSDAVGGEIKGELSYSHNFLAAVIFSMLFYLGSLVITRNHLSSYVLGVVVFSHWVLDFIVWDNMAWLPRSPQDLGMGLYSRIGLDPVNAQVNFATIFATILELTMLAIGIWVYSQTRKQMKAGRRAL